MREFLRRLFRVPCKHVWDVTDFWWLEEGVCLRMDTCAYCNDFRLEQVV